jgi:hypothetical protein
VKINFKTLALNMQGEKIYPSPAVDKEGFPVSETQRVEAYPLGFFVIDALLAGERDLPGIEKLKRYKLAQKIQSPAKETDITIEEAALIKEVTGKYSATLIMGQIWELLEENGTGKKNKDGN